MSRVQEAYISMKSAAKQSGLSPRRLTELAAKGIVGRRREKNAETGRVQSTFLADDIKKYLAGAPAVSTAVAVRPGEIAANSGYSAAPPLETAAPACEWLTIAQSAHYTGLPESYLLELVAREELPARDVGIRPGGRWRVSKRRLDALAG